MDEITDIRPGKWTLLILARGMHAPLLSNLHRLAERSPLTVLDGGNRFNAYLVARGARGQTDLLERITVSRAFTCYQMLTLLESTPAPLASCQPVPAQARPGRDCARAAGSRPAALPPRLILVLDLLNTFYDESVRVHERRRLLTGCIAHLDRLSRPAGGAVTVHPPAVPSPEAIEFVRMLEVHAADMYLPQQPPALPFAQPRLF
jgi:hypothetical protein